MQTGQTGLCFACNQVFLFGAIQLWTVQRDDRFTFFDKLPDVVGVQMFDVGFVLGMDVMNQRFIVCNPARRANRATKRGTSCTHGL